MGVLDALFKRAIDSVYERFDTRNKLAQSPLLAHYTDIRVAEAILRNGEIWFSNPLCMNDTEEVRWGVETARPLLENSDGLSNALATAERRKLFWDAYDNREFEFSTRHALDLYAFCLSEHGSEDWDGRLTMWRAYGASGSGAAIIFRTAPILEDGEVENLYLAPVKYGTEDERRKELTKLIEDFAAIASNPMAVERTQELALHCFQCVLNLSLLLKHKCFEDEREWRIIYMGHLDQDRELADDCCCDIGRNGPEPKLKFKIRPLKGMRRSNLQISDLVDRIILGPGIATPLAEATFERVVVSAMGQQFRGRVKASTIPFRTRR